MRSAAAAALLIFVAAACSSPTPSESAPAVMATSTPAPIPTAAPVILPAHAPLKPSDCGWQDPTPVAFAGWATVTDLDASQMIQGNPLAHVYALVSRDPVELHPMIGSPMLTRGYCAILQEACRPRAECPTTGPSMASCSSRW
jgi:hypothetical protein